MTPPYTTAGGNEEAHIVRAGRWDTSSGPASGTSSRFPKKQKRIEHIGKPMMEGVLVKIMLLLLSGTCSSSQDSTSNIVENKEKYFTTTGLVSDGSRDDATSNKVSGEIETSTAELPTFRASTKESGVTMEQEVRSNGGTSVEESSTSSSSKPLSTTVRLRSVIDVFNTQTDLSVTSHEHNKTEGHETTPSHPNYETTGTSKPVDSKRTSNPTSPPPKGKPSKNDSNMRTVILIAICMVILILILIAVIVVLVRNKRRSGSQSFHTQSRSSKRENVWAGQVPDLGEGKITERPVGTENGAAGNKPEKEQEMITFISSEKKDDSVEALNETNNGAAQEEQTPLLEDAPQEKEETAATLKVEQELV